MNPPAFEVLRPDAVGPAVILCDHASNHVPAELNGLGLDEDDLARHIAWDIGAAGVARELSNLLDAPAILCGTSRLVIDCNRHLNSAGLIPQISDGTVIPGNHNLTRQAKQARIERWFAPYHDEIEALLKGRTPLVLSIHSMTPVLAGVARPWQISLSSHSDRSLVDPLLRKLRGTLGDAIVGDNQPYDLDPAFDYTIPFHAMRRNLPYLQVEFRQDEVADEKGQAAWAQRLASSL